MPFQKGKPKTGGRAKGTPNKDNPLKTLLHEHSVDYFTRNIPVEDVDIGNEEWKQNHAGMLSHFEIDLMCMKESERAKAEIELLSYHTPKMQAISADMSVKDANKTITDRISRLAAGEEIPADEV